MGSDLFINKTICGLFVLGQLNSLTFWLAQEYSLWIQFKACLVLKVHSEKNERY